MKRQGHPESANRRTKERQGRKKTNTQELEVHFVRGAGHQQTGCLILKKVTSFS